MTRRIAVMALAALLAAPATSRAGIERAGTTAANFTQVGTGAGILGMGGATLGLAGHDLASVSWNAASLARVNNTQMGFSHVGLAEGSAQEWAAVAGALNSMPLRWAVTGLYQGDGSFEGRDALGNPTGTFSASSMAFGVTGAYTVLDDVGVGLAIEYVSETLGDVHGSGVAFDLGVQATRGRYGIGAALQNTGGKMRYDGVSYPFAANFGVGVSMTDPGTGLVAALDFNVPNAYYSDMRAGVEWRYQDRFALRTGYRHELGAETNEPMSGPTFGMGAGANGFWLDYALLMGGASGEGQHRFGLTYRPGGADGVASAPASATATKKAPPAPAKTAAAKTPAKTTGKTAAATGTVALDTAPPRQLATTPRSMPQARDRAQTAKPTGVAVPGDAPKTIPVVAIPPAAPGPVTFKSGDATKTKADSAKADSSKAAAPTEAPKPSETSPTGAAAPETPQAGGPASPSTVETPTPAVAAPVVTETAKPVEAPKPEPVKPAETPKIEPAKTTAPAPTKAAPAAPEIPRPTHVVLKKGQTLEDIAAIWGCTPAAIMMENNLTTQKAPKAGTKLKLPPKKR